eukprot:7635631-Pyramimonas_sp.AAC.1
MPLLLDELLLLHAFALDAAVCVWGRKGVRYSINVLDAEFGSCNAVATLTRLCSRRCWAISCNSNALSGRLKQAWACVNRLTTLSLRSCTNA